MCQIKHFFTLLLEWQMITCFKSNPPWSAPCNCHEAKCPSCRVFKLYRKAEIYLFSAYQTCRNKSTLKQCCMRQRFAKVDKIL